IRLVWDKYKLKFPVIGDLQKRIMLAQFTQTLSMILFAGVPILKGFTLAANAAENFYVTDQLLKMRTAISHGEKFSYAASLSNLFDPTVLQMLEVGEETGKLDTMLTKVSAAYTDEIDYRLKNLSDLLEPMLLAVVGVLIGLMALAIYLPMWDIVKFAR
ncbi:MAG: type II secretion system F family protein, partial [Gammaproteobacteria bacterium]|nr:type II secretion system F family protein [Gammaproteobacteria bacterium]